MSRIREHIVPIIIGGLIGIMLAAPVIVADDDEQERVKQLGVELQQSERNNASLLEETTKNAQLQDTQIKALQAEIIALKKERDELAGALAANRAEARATRSRRYSSIARDTRVSSPAVASGSVWDRLAQCEAGGNWSINTGNGYYGGLQFNIGSWRGVGGSGYPHQNSREEQIRRGKILQSRQGWGAWPACSRKLGLR